MFVFFMAHCELRYLTLPQGRANIAFEKHVMLQIYLHIQEECFAAQFEKKFLNSKCY